MKKTRILLFAIIITFAFTSCFLFPQDVDPTDTQEFLDGFEENGGVEFEGENTDLSMAAAGDFFGKGGTAANYLIPFGFMKLDGSTDTKLLFPFAYGTYEVNTLTDSFDLVDASTPANGYLYKWSFVDPSTDEEHDVELLFDSLTYYSGDPDDETPTRLYICMEIDGINILFINYHAEYTTEDGMFLPTDLTLTWGIEDEFNITVGFACYYEDDAYGDLIPVIEEANLRLEDEIADEWVEYTITSTGDETGNIVVEYSDGWKIDVDTEEPETVIGEFEGNPDYEYEMIAFAGELTENGNHAADLEGEIWAPESLTNSDYQSYMIAIFPDGTEYNLDINIMIPNAK